MPSSRSYSVFTNLGCKPNMAQIGWYKETVNNNTSQIHTHTNSPTVADLLTAKRQAVKHSTELLPSNLTEPHTQVKSLLAVNISLTQPVHNFHFSHCNSTGTCLDNGNILHYFLQFADRSDYQLLQKLTISKAIYEGYNTKTHRRR